MTNQDPPLQISFCLKAFSFTSILHKRKKTSNYGEISLICCQHLDSLLALIMIQTSPGSLVFYLSQLGIEGQAMQDKGKGLSERSSVRMAKINEQIKTLSLTCLSRTSSHQLIKLVRTLETVVINSLVLSRKWWHLSL